MIVFRDVLGIRYTFEGNHSTFVSSLLTGATIEAHSIEPSDPFKDGWKVEARHVVCWREF